jgi:drug/metabolite transporter superfamily protein YnfA
MIVASNRACLVRGFAVWILIALAETIHGTLRTILLAPRVGDQASRQVGVLTGSLMIMVIAYITITWIGASTGRQQAAIGALWVGLMLIFEVTLGRALGLSWERIASDYLPSQGGLMVLGMAVLALAPTIAFRLRSRRR